VLDLRPSSYRVLLLATVAGVALGGGAYAQTGPGPVKQVAGGQTLNNSSAITATSGPAVQVIAPSSNPGSVVNSGLIQSTGANGAGIQVVSGGSAATITNSGTVQATNGGNGIVVQSAIGSIGSVGTLANSGLIQVAGGGQAVYIESGSSIAAILNSGTIAQLGTGAPQDAINVAGSAGLISNTGLIQGGTAGVGIRVEGAVGTINNGPGGTINATGIGNAIYVVGTAGAAGTVGTIANSGLIQSVGSNAAAIIVSGIGSIGTIANNTGGVIEATGNAPAIVDGGTIGVISNSGTIITTGGGPAIATNSTTAAIGTIANAGMIESSGTNSAIAINSGASITSIINVAIGTIMPAASGTGVAISIAGAAGSINNSGLIQVASSNDVAVIVSGSAGTITNGAGGLIQVTGTNDAAIRVTGSVASITNAGTLMGAGASGTGQGDSAVRVDGTVGAIASTGLMQVTNGAGIHAFAGSIGSVTNSGTIQVLSSGNAILIGNSAAASIGAVTNTGLMQSAGTNSAIAVQSLGTLGSLANNTGGVVTAIGTGGGVFVGGTLGSVTNGGSIIATQGTAISIGVGSTGTVAGTVLNGTTNTASGLIQGGPSNGSGVAISDVGGTTTALTINNAGTIIGAVDLGPKGDTLNVTGGAITGAIIGLAGSNDIVNFSPTGTFTTGGSITNVDTINVTKGTLVLQNPATSAYGASAFSISSGAVTDMKARIQAVNVNNAGLLNVGSGSQTITGNYHQATTGSLGVTVLGAGAANAGKLTVTGTAAILGGANAVSVHVPTSVDDFGLVGNSWHVLTAGTLTANASALTAASDNAGISFGLTDSATDLIISALAQTPSQVLTAAANDVNTIFAPFPGAPTFSQIEARLFLTQVFVQLASTGNLALAHQLDTVLANLTSSQVLQLNNQLMPSTLQSAFRNLTATTDITGTGESTIFGRETASRLGTGQTGLAAGDNVGRGFTFWGQPFGAVTSQGAQDGFDGYTAGTYGITLGADTLVTPQFRAGAALVLSNTNLSYSGSLSGNTGDVFTAELGLYGTYYLPNNFFIDGLLAFAYNHYNQKNLISALGLSLNSDYGGTLFTAKIGGGYDYKLPAGAVITPYVSVQQYHFNFDSYTTSGGSAFDLDTHVNGSSADLTQTRLGLRVGEPVKLANGGLLTPEIHAYWLHDFGNNVLSTSYTTANFASPNSFTLIGPALERDMANVGIGATFSRGQGWSFSGGYDFLGGSSISTHNFYVQLKIEF